MWKKENLLLIRELEKEIKADPYLPKTCLSMPIPGFDMFGMLTDPVPDEDGEFKMMCIPNYFRSVLDVIPMFL